MPDMLTETLSRSVALLLSFFVVCRPSARRSVASTAESQRSVEMDRTGDGSQLIGLG